MTEPAGIRTEARGSHWVAWLEREGQQEPPLPMLMVGRTQEEAEARLREWWAARRDVPSSPSR